MSEAEQKAMKTAQVKLDREMRSIKEMSMFEASQATKEKFNKEKEGIENNYKDQLTSLKQQVDTLKADSKAKSKDLAKANGELKKKDQEIELISNKSNSFTQSFTQDKAPYRGAHEYTHSEEDPKLKNEKVKRLESELEKVQFALKAAQDLNKA